MGSLAAETTTGEAQLYERHSDLVFRYCLRMLGTREDAEDAAQTTFFQALRALRRGVVPNFEQAWLLTIARNECKSRYRAGSRRRQRELTRDPQSLEELAEAPNGGDGRLIGVQHALTRLPEMQRRALLLREWQGRSYAEIAHELGTTRPAVEALLFRARRGLARELGEETRGRRHAFDVASLLGALKSVLGGGAAVKLAAGVAAVATVGTVAGGTGRGPVPVLPARHAVNPAPVVAETTKADAVGVSTPSRRGQAERLKPSATRTPVARRSAPASGRSDAPATPGADKSASDAAPAVPPGSPRGPVSPPVQAPSLPAVPSVPAPQPPSVPLPIGQLPQVPPLPPLPPLPQVPEVPQLPQVPDVSLPEVPDLPNIPVLP